MQHRKLGNTGLEVSVIGLGCAMLGSSNTEYAVQIVRRALELGVTFFDVARVYRDAEVKVGLGVRANLFAGQRERVVISTKTAARTRDDAWREINESLERLCTGYVDNCHLHALGSSADIDRRLGSGGALEALIEAREQGLIHHIGCTSHRSELLIEAIKRFAFEVILVPMNIVEREPLDELIPLCQEKGIGVTIMKPVATGLLPAQLALKWLLNQPIACAVPGATTVQEIEENALVGHHNEFHHNEFHHNEFHPDWTLTPQERTQVRALQEELEHVRCRICHRCEPCPQEIPIGILLGTDIMYDHYRSMGPQGFRTFCWSREAVEKDLPGRKAKIARIESCTRCGECEARCPYGLPIMEMLHGLVPAMQDMVRIYEWLVQTSEV